VSSWIACSDRLPEIDMTAPKYAQRVRVIAGKPGYVGELTFGTNAYAKNHVPHWQESSGREAVWTPTHWIPLPDQPQEL
jgi:hypothetical protein